VWNPVGVVGVGIDRFPGCPKSGHPGLWCGTPSAYLILFSHWISVPPKKDLRGFFETIFESGENLAEQAEKLRRSVFVSCPPSKTTFEVFSKRSLSQVKISPIKRKNLEGQLKVS